MNQNELQTSYAKAVMYTLVELVRYGSAQLVGLLTKLSIICAVILITVGPFLLISHIYPAMVDIIVSGSIIFVMVAALGYIVVSLIRKIHGKALLRQKGCVCKWKQVCNICRPFPNY